MSDDEVPEMPEKSNKRIALFITFLALLFALAELGAKSSQTDAIAYNVNAADTWAFFQAKSIRQTTLRTAAESMEASLDSNASPEIVARQKKMIADWRATADRYESDPAKGEGKKELTEKALAFEHHRDDAMEHYHVYEMAGVVLQISVVLASTSVVTGMSLFVILSAIGGGLGIVLSLIAAFAPGLFHVVLAMFGGH
jgi:Domain of unknown function (DUF4337)